MRKPSAATVNQPWVKARFGKWKLPARTVRLLSLIALALGFFAETRASTALTGGPVELVSPKGGTESFDLASAEDFDLSHSVVFEASLELERPPGGEYARTPVEDINFDADYACIVLRQFDDKGRELAADASLGVVDPGTHRLRVEAAPLPGTARIVLECRLSKLPGRAVFSDFNLEVRADRLYLPARAQRVVSGGNSPGMRIDGRDFPPLMFHGQNLETSRDARASVRDLHLPYQHGLRVFSFNAWFPGVTAQNTHSNLALLTGAYPQAWFMIRVWLGPKGGFFRDYPEEMMAFNEGSHRAAYAPPASQRWQRYMEASVRQFALRLRKSPAVERVAGIVPMYYITGEWQLGDADGPYLGGRTFRTAGFSEPMQMAFAQWALKRYGGLESLNAAWGTRYSSREAIAVPTAAERAGQGSALRHPDENRRVIDYSRFVAESLTDAIILSCKAFNTAFHERVLAGPFYGHLLEHAWSANGLIEQGHYAINRILASDAVDFYGAPYSYNNDNRSPGEPLDTNAILESAALHGKLAFLEEDTFTHVAEPPKGFIAPGAHQQTESLQETLDVLLRNLGSSMARGYIHYWMGLLQDGRFDLPEIWEAYAPVLDWLADNPRRPAYRPQIGLVIDEEALPMLRQGTRALSGRWLHEVRSYLGRVDSTLGIYLQSDLNHIPESVRLLILATPYNIDEAQAETLERRWKRDGRVLVFAAPVNPYQRGALSASSLTGMEFSLVDSARQPVSRVAGSGPFASWAGSVIGEPIDRSVAFWQPNAKLPPLRSHPVIEDPQAVPLAYYRGGDSAVSVALKEQDGWTSVVTAVHALTPAMWRKLLQHAGGHTWFSESAADFEHPDVVEATDDFLMIISGRSAERTIQLPEARTLRPLLDGMREASPEPVQSFTQQFEADRPYMWKLSKP